MKRNRYSKALKILKSTDVNEKLSALDESLPTNHTKGVYALNDPGFRVGQKDPQKVYYPDVDGNWPAGIPGTPGELEYVRPEGYWSGGSDWETQVSTDFSQDYLETDPTGRSTDTLIGADGTVFSGLPPGGEGFILGPIVDGFVPNHGSDAYTNIGYIQKDTRQFVLLARIQGQWKADLNGSYSTWNGTSTGFTSYNQNFTLEMAQWVRDKILADAYVSKVPYFYSGGVPQRPQSPADCPNCPPGMYGGNGIDPRQFGDGGDPSIGSEQDPARSGDEKDAGFPWGKDGNEDDLADLDNMGAWLAAAAAIGLFIEGVKTIVELFNRLTPDQKRRLIEKKMEMDSDKGKQAFNTDKMDSDKGNTATDYYIRPDGSSYSVPTPKRDPNDDPSKWPSIKDPVPEPMWPTPGVSRMGQGRA